MKKLLVIVSDFCCEYLDNSSFKALEDMQKEDRFEFGGKLYNSLLYDSSIMDESFRDAVKKFSHLNENADINESIYGDIRAFFG